MNNQEIDQMVSIFEDCISKEVSDFSNTSKHKLVIKSSHDVSPDQFTSYFGPVTYDTTKTILDGDYFRNVAKSILEVFVRNYGYNETLEYSCDFRKLEGNLVRLYIGFGKIFDKVA